MTQGAVMGVLQQGIIVTLKIAAPLLLVSVVLGLIVAIFQAATQIHEQTLTFVPKVLAIALLLWLLGSWMISTFQDFFNYLMQIILGI